MQQPHVIAADLHRPPSYLDHGVISHWIDSLGAELRAQRFCAVAAVLRGGLFPAHCAATVTGAPLCFLAYDRTRQRAAWHGDPPPPGRLLVCEDMAGSGHTLAHCLAWAARTHPDHRVLTVVSDELSRLTPDWSLYRPNVRTVLPWEREAVTEGFTTDWHAGGARGDLPMRPDPAYRRWGVDLDGVLCGNIDEAGHERDLAAALAERDALRRDPGAPALSPQRHCIVTGRPAGERKRTRAWLEANGYGGIDVHYRDPAHHGSAVDAVAAHKLQVAQRCGLSDFVASCPRQAVLMAAQAPRLRVFWWRGGAPVLVNASAATVDLNP